MRILLVTFAVLALAGCGAQHESTDTAATHAPSGDAASTPAESTTPGAGVTDGAGAGDAVVATAPRLIEELTDQKLVYECPKCGMDFDAAGKCSMDGAELVAMRVGYSCPADGKAVERAGKCPRCAMNARVEKTALAAAPATDKN